MHATRLLASLAAGALVAAPGLALAQGGDPPDTRPVESPPVERPATPDVEEPDDEGRGAAVSALAQCLPSGRDLHGTGLTKGFVMRQAAAGGPIVLPDGRTFGIGDVCDVVKAMVGAEAPDTARGRPDWAGPKGEDDEELTTRRGGPAG